MAGAAFGACFTASAAEGFAVSFPFFPGGDLPLPEPGVGFHAEAVALRADEGTNSFAEA